MTAQKRTYLRQTQVVFDDRSDASASTPQEVHLSEEDPFVRMAGTP